MPCAIAQGSSYVDGQSYAGSSYVGSSYARPILRWLQPKEDWELGRIGGLCDVCGVGALTRTLPLVVALLIAKSMKQ